jgi:hypothetical protein
MAAAAAPAAPVWPLLAVAGITVVGTLGATVLTLLWSARREDRRWLRERQDRYEQDRAEEYAKLVAALHAWYTALISARAGRANAELLGEELHTTDVWRQCAATVKWWPWSISWHRRMFADWLGKRCGMARCTTSR